MCERAELLAWAPLRAKADAWGLSERAGALWRASKLPAWLEQCRANIEKRRAEAAA